MPEEQQSSEKTEEPTPKRLRDARKKGQVAKSKDVDTVLILIAAFVILAFMYKFMGDEFKELINVNLQVGQFSNLSDEGVLQYGITAFKSFMRVMAPYLIILVSVALLVGFLQVGPIFSGEPVKFRTDRLNIVKNLQNMFKVTTLIELLKNIAKILLIFWIAYYVVSANLREIVTTVSATPEQSLTVATKILMSFLVKVFICFAVIALIDFAVQKWHYKKQLRMTKEEVKREYKEDEGDPLIKSMRKQLHRELAMSDVKQAVGASDVVITNPTDVAIALKYDETEMMAPQIMAKGQRLFAEGIIDFAKEASIPIVQNIPVAWALVELDVGDEIPEELYAAVAEILSIIYRMKETKAHVS